MDRDKMIEAAAAFENPTQFTYEMMADFALERIAVREKEIAAELEDYFIRSLGWIAEAGMGEYIAKLKGAAG